MSKKKYVQLLDSIKASDDAVEKAVNSIYKENFICYETKKKTHFKLVPVVAAVLVLVLFTGILGSSLFVENTENGFIMKASAAEINAFENVEIGNLKGNSNAVKLCFDDSNKAYCIIQCKTVEFPVLCSGKNIDKINYKINGNGYFSLLENMANISDLVYVDEKPVTYSEAETYPYDVATVEGSTEKVLSYTVDYEAQSESKPILVLYVSDYNGRYCSSYNENLHYNEDENTKIYGKHFDYEDMYYNIFNENNYRIDVTVTYKDGTTETKTLDLTLEKTLKHSEDGSGMDYTALTVNASLAK